MPKYVTFEEFNLRIAKRFPDEHFTLLLYQGMGKPAIIKCDHCGKEIEVNRASNFLVHSKAYGCVNCHGLWKQRELKIKKIEEFYDILGTQIKDTHTYYTVKCKKCGHERTATLAALDKHTRCGCETGVVRKRTAKEFIDTVNKYSQDKGYDLVSDYVNQTTKVLLRHRECGFIWSVWPADVLHGRSKCPKCGKKESRGARFITKTLKELNINFDKERQLKGSRQRFDFYIPGNSFTVAIEYNGAQHYKEIKFLESTLEHRKKLDQRKREYCKKENIELIEIPYWFSDEQIKGILIELAQRLSRDGVDLSGSK